jgi:hypothetical protein
MIIEKIKVQKVHVWEHAFLHLNFGDMLKNTPQLMTQN